MKDKTSLRPIPRTQTSFALRLHAKICSTPAQDQRRPAWTPSKAASNATSTMNTSKLSTKNFRISWNPFHHALKKFWNRSSRKKSSRTKWVLSHHVKKFWNLKIVKLRKVRSKNSKLTSNTKRNWENSSMKFARNWFRKSQASFSQLPTLSGSITPRSWIRDFLNPNWLTGPRICQRLNSSNTESSSKRQRKSASVKTKARSSPTLTKPSKDSWNSSS